LCCDCSAYRLVEIISNKIFNIQKDEAQLECINNAPTKLYRIEEIPKEELDLADDEIIVQVAHFNKVCSLVIVSLNYYLSSCCCQLYYELIAN